MKAAALAFFLATAGAACAGAAAATAPVTLPSGADGVRATIPVRIDGQFYQCVLDTGTSVMLLSQSVAQAAGLAAGSPIAELAPDGMRYTDYHTQINRFSAGGYRLTQTPALISPELGAGKVLCGYDFFAAVPTLIDRDRQTVTLFPAPALLAAMHCIPVDLRARVPLATVLVNGAAVQRVVLDSGMTGGGALWSGVADALPQPLGADPGYRTLPAAMSGGLLCGRSAHVAFYPGASGDTIDLCSSIAQPDGYNGILQTNLPSVHRLAVDYPDKRVCFS